MSLQTKKNRITVELQTDDDKIFQLYNVLNSTGKLSDFLESLVLLRLNNYEAKVSKKESVKEVKPEENQSLTLNNSVLNLFYDLKESLEEIKENIGTQPKVDLDLNSIEGVVKSALSTVTIPATSVMYSASSEIAASVNSMPTIKPVEEVKNIDLSYLDDGASEVVRTSKSSTNGDSTTNSTSGKKSLKGMNLAKMKKLKGG